VHIVAAEGGASLLVPATSDLVWGIVAFVVIFGVLTWKALPRVQKLLDERAAAIEGRIDEAKNARAEAEQILDRYQQQLADARVEAGRIRDQAREDGKRIVEEQREAAQVEAARIVTQAQSQIESQRAQAIASLRAEVGSLALDLASAVVGEHLAKDANATAYVDRFLADLQIEHAADGVRE
jgi:F-type H+-transporting ATPase subunit b